MSLNSGKCLLFLEQVSVKMQWFSFFSHYFGCGFYEHPPSKKNKNKNIKGGDVDKQ